MNSLLSIFKKPIFSDRRFLFGLWLLLAVMAGIAKMAPERCNNFIIFESVYWHAQDHLPLYDYYPEEYHDHNLYGPVFSLLVAPFALLPHAAGLILWLVVLTAALFLAVRGLPGRKGIQIFIYWFCAHELLTALFMQQFNIAVAAIIVGSFALVEREKDIWATLLIMIGGFVKIYGLAGLAFFFFSKHKRKFVLYSVGWAIVLFFVPMMFWGCEYVLSQYTEWFYCLVDKNELNHTSENPSVSLIGFSQRVFGFNGSDLWLMGPGLLLFLLPFLRRNQWQNLSFRFAFLASVLLFVVLFSSGSESSGYITALTGVVIWFSAVPQKRRWWDVVLLVFAFILTSMSPSDLFPAYLREHYVKPYALKALPCIIIWCKLIVEMLTADYKSTSSLLSDTK